MAAAVQSRFDLPLAVVSPSEPDRLLARIAARDEVALGQLYDLMVSRVYGVAMRLLRDRADAEEAVGDTFQQVWERARQFAPERGSATSWLLVIAYTRSLDIKRRRAQRDNCETLHPEDDDPAYVEHASRDVDDLVNALQLGSAVRKAMQSLPGTQQRLVTMAFLEGLTHPEVAERTGLPLGTVKSHIRRGLLSLREQLARLQ